MGKKRKPIRKVVKYAPKLVPESAASLGHYGALAFEIKTNPIKLLTVNFSDELAKSPYVKYRRRFMDYLAWKLYSEGDMTLENMSWLMEKFKTCDDVVKLFIARAKEISEINHSYQATILLAIYSAKVFARLELAASSESAFFLHLLSQVNDNDLRHFELIYDHAAALEPKFTPVYACDAYYQSIGDPVFQQLPPQEREAALLARLSDDPEFVSFYTSTDKLTFLGVLMQRSFSFGSSGHTQISLNPNSDTLKELIEESRLLEDSLRRSSRPS